MGRVLYYETSTLEGIAENILIQYDPFFFHKAPQPAPIEHIIEEIFNLDIVYMCLTEAGDELGRMIYDNGYTTRFNAKKDGYEWVRVTPGTMLIEARLLEKRTLNGRYRFTLGHELGHWVLHKYLYAGTHRAAASYGIDEQSVNSVEWQANYIAKAILMPVVQVRRSFRQLRWEYGPDAVIIPDMAEIFEVSKQAMGIRLSELGLI